MTHRRTGASARLVHVGAITIAGLVVSIPLSGQQVPAPGQPQFFPPDTAFVPLREAEAFVPATPRGAFLRALMIPGWGHIATRSYTRAGFYVAARGGGLWMLGTALRRRSDARSFVRTERMVAEARLEAMGMSDPDSIAAAVSVDPAVLSWEALEESRGQQVEDWAAISIFLVLLSAADAYVSAHLTDFPEPLSIRALPVGTEGAVEFTFALPLGRPPSPVRSAR